MINQTPLAHGCNDDDCHANKNGINTHEKKHTHSNPHGTRGGVSKTNLMWTQYRLTHSIRAVFTIFSACVCVFIVMCAYSARVVAALCPDRGGGYSGARFAPCDEQWCVAVSSSSSSSLSPLSSPHSVFTRFAAESSALKYPPLPLPFFPLPLPFTGVVGGYTYVSAAAACAHVLWDCC